MSSTTDSLKSQTALCSPGCVVNVSAGAVGATHDMMLADRAWFNSHPGREYHVRPIGEGDADLFPFDVLPTTHIVVRRVIGIGRVRMPCDLLPGDDIATDAGSAAVWGRATAHVPNMRAFIRGARRLGRKAERIERRETKRSRLSAGGSQ